MADKKKPKGKIIIKPQFMWWTKGNCVAELIETGHFPTTVMVKLESGIYTEVEMEDLEEIRAGARF